MSDPIRTQVEELKEKVFSILESVESNGNDSALGIVTIGNQTADGGTDEIMSLLTTEILRVLEEIEAVNKFTKTPGYYEWPKVTEKIKELKARYRV